MTDDVVFPGASAAHTAAAPASSGPVAMDGPAFVAVPGAMSAPEGASQNSLDSMELTHEIDGLSKRADSPGAHGAADYAIVLVRPGESARAIDTMFDANAVETFDPTDAVEVVDSDGVALPLRVGDRLMMAVVFTG